jgi:16S rRNA G966 N2-methylase RsmD
LHIVERNLDRCRLADRAACYLLSLPGGLSKLRTCEAPFDVIYADPPFAFNDHYNFLAKLAEEGILSPQGIVAIEHAKNLHLPDKAGDLALTRRKVYGSVVLSFFA